MRCLGSTGPTVSRRPFDKLSHPEEFTERYRQLQDHYGLEATQSQAGCSRKLLSISLKTCS